MYIVIFLIVIILILILRICYFEKFATPTPGCNFRLNPSNLERYGDDVNKCIMDCYANPVYENCSNSKKCQEICLNCDGNDIVEGVERRWSENEKKEKCGWYKKIKETDSREPEAPIIKGYAADSSILIEWQRPYDNNSTITNYIIDVSESMNKKTSSKLIYVKDNSCKVCEFKIKGLRNQVNHKVNIRAVNSNGIGPISNTVEVTPNGVNTELLKNIENDINADVDVNLNINNYDCMNGYKYNDLSIDELNLNEIDIAKHVKELQPVIDNN